jgi:hypothetical protein
MDQILKKTRVLAQNKTKIRPPFLLLIKDPHTAARVKEAAIAVVMIKITTRNLVCFISAV